MTTALLTSRRVPAARGAWPWLARAVAVLVAAASLVLAGAAGAHAHVSVVASNPSGGAWTLLTFRVPSESATASTTGLRVTIPDDVTFTQVRVQPLAGWQAEVVREADSDGEERVTEVVWEATDEGLGPDEFQEFALSVGPLPEEGTVHFPTVQEYSDGSTADWVQQATGDAEPDYPAPSIDIVPTEGDTADSHGVDSAPADAAAESAAESTGGASEVEAAQPSWLPLTLSVIALVVAIGGAAAAWFAPRRRR
jgi:uncharacterized protein YcnI